MYHVTVHADSGSVAFTRERMLPCDTEERTRPCGPSSPAAARRPRQRDRRGYHIDAGIKANESLADRYSIATERKLGKSGREPNQPSRCARTMASYHRGKWESAWNNRVFPSDRTRRLGNHRYLEIVDRWKDHRFCLRKSLPGLDVPTMCYRKNERWTDVGCYMRGKSHCTRSYVCDGTTRLISKDKSDEMAKWPIIILLRR